MGDGPQLPPIDPDDPFGFNDNPMAVREFLQAHDAINTPWFRTRFFFALWRETIAEWFRGLVRWEVGSQTADGCGRPQAMSGIAGNSSSQTDHRKECREMPSVVEQLPALLRLMADPTTPHTTNELWCRIAADDWERHAPSLLHELQTGENDVKRLVLSIICEQASHVRTTPIQPFLGEIERLLTDDDRLVRMAAIEALRHLYQHCRDEDVASTKALALLHRISCNDELPLARESMLALLEMDDSAVLKIALLLRD